MTTTGDPPRPAALEQLSAQEKRALLLRLMQARERRTGEPQPGEAPRPLARPGADPDWPTIQPDPALQYEPFVLTDIQHAYWIGRGDGLELGGVGAHIYSEFDLPVSDVPRMSRAWRQVIARHGLLRMVVRPDGRQQVLPEVPEFEIREDDLRGLPATERTARLDLSREQMQARLYDSGEWPMFGVRAFLLEDGLTRVCLSFDMLILDLRSFQTVLEEWFQFYGDPELSLPPLPISFRDYRLAEQTLEGGEAARQAQAYWTARLDDLPPSPPLPMRRVNDRERPDVFSRRRFVIGPERWNLLKSAASVRGVTLAALLLSAFAQVLATWSGERHFTLNLTVFNRLPLHPAVPKLVGDFTSTVLLEFDLNVQEDFSARVGRVQRQLWSDLEHRQFSGVRVQRELARQYGAARALSPVVFTSHLTGGLDLQESVAPTFPVELGYGLSQTPQVYLDHQVYEHGGGLVVQWDARDGLFAQGVLDQMFAAQQAMLGRLIDEPRTWNTTQHALAPVPHLPAPGRSDTELSEIGSPPAFRHDPATSSATLHGLFEAQVARTPDAPALIAERRTFTYRALNERAEALARSLAQSLDNSAPGTLVAVVTERGWEGVVAVLAILKSGAAYLPIDPDQPEERLRLLLETSGARQVLSHSRRRQPQLHATLTRLLGGLPGLQLTEIGDGLGQEAVPRGLDSYDDSRPAQPTDLAYVIYTSGSTGVPKGVMINHRGVVNTVLDLNARYRVGPGDVVLGVSALTFDLSVYDLFGTFAAGAALVLPDHARRRDPQHWRELTTQHGVTVWNSVPALLQMLLSVGDTGLEGDRSDALPARLRLVLLSGDWIPPRLARRLLAEWPGVHLVSLGGATEASVWSVLHDVGPADAERPSIPYGRAMTHQTAEVLDASLNPVPDLVPGELFIGGVGLALGYWRDAERSAERFFYHPRSGRRLYRSGDLARRLPDGTLELLGRVDRQVKIHGHRIEPGEIEAALQEQPGVREALVTVRPGVQGQPLLTAYIVPDQTLQDDGQEALMAELLGSVESLRPFQSGDTELDRELALLGTLEERSGFKGRHLARPAPERVQARLPLGTPDGPHLVRLAERRNVRRFSLQALSSELLLSWLGSLLADPFTGRRRYASAGDLYPVQTYLYLKPGRVGELAAGLYLLDVQAGELLVLEAAPLDRAAYHPLINRPMYDEAAFALFLVAELRAIAPVYGERSLHFATLEAGLMTGLLELQAASTPLGLCQVGELNAAEVAATLRLTPTQRLLHSLVGGRLEHDQRLASQAAGVADLRPAARLGRLQDRVAAMTDEEARQLLRALRPS